MSPAGQATLISPPAPAPAPPGEACPLCGAALAPEQEWCLRCGAAARTRLAAAPNWKAPFAAVAIVSALALGGLAAALVKLAGDTGPAPPPVTRVVTAAAPAAPSAVPTTATTPPTATAPGAANGGTAPGAGQSTATSPATTTPSKALGGIDKSPTKQSQQTGKQRHLTPDQERRLKELNLSGQIK